jgi:hypothetical protein
MRRALAAVLCVALVLGLGAAAMAAQSPRNRSKARPLAPGQLQISGTGAITLNGQFTAFGSIPDENGTLVVQDQRGDATVTLNGVHQQLRGRRLNLRRAQGSFYIKGSRVSARLQGTNLSVSAAGRGQATVAGIGTYVLNGADAQDWPPGFALVDLLPPAR